MPPAGDPDHYKTLQVDPEADPEVIQAAYHRLARKYHPDTGGAADPERMARLNAAWEILGDPARRAAYDRARARAAMPGVTTAPTSRTSGDPATRTPSATAPPEGHGAAGPPPGNPSGTVLGFGRYAGWSLGEVARVDVEYLEWLDRAPIGRAYRGELDVLLRKAGRRRAVRPEEGERRGLFRR